MKGSLFRKEALDQLTSPDELDRLMHVTDPKGWLALVALSILVAAAAIWGFTGSIPVEVSGGDGILIKRGSLREVVALDSGTVSDVGARIGDAVEAGQPIARIRTDEGNETDLVSPLDGTVDEVLIQEGMPVERGSQVAIVETGNEPLQAVVYLPIKDAQRVDEGTQVQISPSTVQAEEFGFMQGTVSSVSKVPASERSMSLLLHNEDLIRQLHGEGAQLEMTVDPVPDPSTPSGFKWSSSQGPPFTIANQTLCTATFVLGEKRPVDRVLSSSR